jgi:phosphatidate cytidylyltransferase
MYFLGFIAVAGALCSGEYAGMVAAEDRFAQRVFVLVATCVTLLAMLSTDAGAALLWMHGGALLLIALFTLRTGDMKSVWSRMATLTFGLVYVSLGLVSVYRLRSLGDGMASQWARPSWLYVALIATWSNDTFAYFAGRAFGRHKLYEKVSPKKTWEGFAGGALGSVAMLFLCRIWFPSAFGHLSEVDLLAIGIPAAVLAPVGDLAESLLKRTYGVKDSGNTIPGHGGLLDRVDAVFFVAPWTLLYAVVLRPLLL